MTKFQELITYYKEYVSASTIRILSNMVLKEDVELLSDNYISIIQNMNMDKLTIECDRNSYKNAISPLCTEIQSVYSKLDKMTIRINELHFEIINNRTIFEDKLHTQKTKFENELHTQTTKLENELHAQKIKFENELHAQKIKFENELHNLRSIIYAMFIIIVSQFMYVIYQ